MHQFIIYLVVQGNFFHIRHEGIYWYTTYYEICTQWICVYLPTTAYIRKFILQVACPLMIYHDSTQLKFFCPNTYLTQEVGMKLCNNEDKMRLLLWWRIKFFYTMYECRMVQSKMMIWRIFGLVKLILEFINTGIFVHNAEKTFTYV